MNRVLDLVQGYGGRWATILFRIKDESLRSLMEINMGPYEFDAAPNANNVTVIDPEADGCEIHVIFDPNYLFPEGARLSPREGSITGCTQLKIKDFLWVLSDGDYIAQGWLGLTDVSSFLRTLF